MKDLIENVSPHVNLYRDRDTGIAWIENGSTGISHSAHPNISDTGSVKGMRDRGYWSEGDRTVKSHGFIYNIDLLVTSDTLDDVARQHCQCGGKHAN